MSRVPYFNVPLKARGVKGESRFPPKLKVCKGLKMSETEIKRDADTEVKSESELPLCPVCLDELIAPITIPCGHNTCFNCASVLNKKCPVCRATYTNECKINLVLDQLLAKIIPDYDARRKDIMMESELNTLFARYKKSTRYDALLMVIDEQLMIEGKASVPFLLDLCRKAFINPEPIEDEVLYLLNQLGIEHSKSIVSVVIEGVTYYLCCDSARAVTDFAVTNQAHLSQTDIYRLASSIDSRVSTMFRALNLCAPEDIKWNRDALIKHLLAIQFRPVDSDDDDDSDEDSESDSHSHSSSSE